ncbi:hypothetical protein S40285_03048 [Stachybotrys chlorohalonatus IBT 40285]|uniref:Uncharacterized protein n=1 Tax=Stachybotrys chlorohalonatus (strain IBT 40285) TaxID=1283841 RepID=A0A084QRP7_STAC4|nr:hypothetical protein S40285_03048 [Stachybotrys chlorohalonata IBT 40285]
MDAAAKSIELLTQRKLPENPHHLSYYPDWRYRQPPADDRSTRRFEEWHQTRLQYLTFVSEADRGILFTRSDYDMRDEPPKPPPRDVLALAGKGGEKKKLSLSDYKNKKTTTGTSTSPSEPTIQKRKDADRASAASASSSSIVAAHSHASSHSHPSDSKRPDGPRSRDTHSHNDSKQTQTRGPVADTRFASRTVPPSSPTHFLDSLPPKPPPKSSLPPRPPSPDSKKRVAESNDESRPQKRPKPDDRRPADERSQQPRDDANRRKERDLPSARDAVAQKNGRPPAASALPNGKSMLKAATSTKGSATPVPRSRGSSINGARPSTLPTTRTTPSKTEGSSKAYVPPLLSPLHLSFGDHDRDSSTIESRKKRDDDRDSIKAARPKKPEPPPPTKRPKSPVRLPPLLSPTLPPEIEAELQKRGSKLPDGDSKESQASATSSSKRTTPPEDDEGEKDGEKEVGKDGGKERETLIVTFKISKRNRTTLRRILALPPAKKEPQEQDSSEPGPPPTQAKKRPAGVPEGTMDSIAVKRPRTSDFASSARLPAPATPSKKGSTAMSRVSSTNSQAAAHTPGDLPSSTPSALGSADRAFNGLDLPKGGKADIAAMKDREARMATLGRRLKHNADQAMKGRFGPHATNGNVRPGDASTRLGYVLALESIIAFVTSFHAQNTHRSMCNKACDPSSWESLFPLMEFHQKEMRRLDPRKFQPLYALLLVLQAVAVDELIKCYGTYENPASRVTVPELVKHERARSRIAPHIREANNRIENPDLRPNITPWATVDEVTEMALRVLRRWCREENVDWTPANFKDNNQPSAPAHH